MRRARGSTVVLLLAAAGAVVGAGFAAACRDAPAPYEPPAETPPPPGPQRLTYNPGDDREPAWTPDGDSIVYVAESFGDLPYTDALLVQISADGHGLRTVLPELQKHGAAPVAFQPAFHGDRIAWVQLLRPRPALPCAGSGTDCGGVVDPSQELIDTVFVRTAMPGALDPVNDPRLFMGLEGRTFDPDRAPEGFTGLWVTTYYPFQRLFGEDGSLPVRPSWAPDGERVVVSTGLGLRVWRPGTGTSDPIAGTEDAGWPAWSPTGEWIAYERPLRGPTTTALCYVVARATNGKVTILCAEEKTWWPITGFDLRVVRPDGSESRSLGDGRRPAWAPDGSALYVERSDAIWRVTLADGAATPVEGTEGGTQPAVSPDGTRLAFVRRTGLDEGGTDIWVVTLQP